MLAILVALRRPFDTRARLGAWLLASIAVFCIAPPWGQAAVWRSLPAPLGWLLWVPHLSALSLGAIIASFFAWFRPEATAVHRLRLVALVWVPTAVALVWHARFAWLAVYAPSQPVPSSLWSAFLPVLTLVYAVGGLVLLVWTYRGIVDLNERRRVRVLVAGTLVGVSAAMAVVTVYWAGPDAELAASPFTSTTLFAGTLVSLVFPASLAYAILRHRLLDVSLILRQGLRYALARRAMLSTAPALALLVSLDSHDPRGPAGVGDRGARGWVYGCCSQACCSPACGATRGSTRSTAASSGTATRPSGSSARSSAGSARPARRAGSARTVVEAVEQALHPTQATLLARVARRR